MSELCLYICDTKRQPYRKDRSLFIPHLRIQQTFFCKRPVSKYMFCWSCTVSVAVASASSSTSSPSPSSASSPPPPPLKYVKYVLNWRPVLK